jgi:hypothetical protein
MIRPQILRKLLHLLPPPHRSLTLDLRTQIPLHPRLRSRIKPSFLPLLTQTRLPLRRAFITKLKTAVTSHMVTPKTQLDDPFTPRTGLPTLVTSEIFDFLSGVIVFTDVVRVSLSTTLDTSFDATFVAPQSRRGGGKPIGLIAFGFVGITQER